MSNCIFVSIAGARASIYCATDRDAPAVAEQSGGYGYFGANAKPLLPAPSGRDTAAALWLWRWSVKEVRRIKRERACPECGVCVKRLLSRQCASRLLLHA